jgi:glycerol-3-phosphate dehydrogenase
MRNTREQRIQRLRDQSNVDVLIVGAGINGIGTFRDLALQGVNVLLIDRADYCSGASAASSHMVHGGIRYLENGEFRLVREAVRERNRLIENAPQLVKPLPTTFPIFKWFSGFFNAPLKFLGLLNHPSERGAFVIKIGMWFYDWFTRAQGTVPRHAFLNRAQSLAKFPMVNPDILFTATYFDAAMTSPERLALEVLKDGVAEGEHAVALNYVNLVSVNGPVAILRDETTGKELSVTPKVLVNAAGPWIDLVNAKMGKPTQYIGGTKGSHIVLVHPELQAAIGDHEFFFENEDGRFVLIFPLEDRILVGTTDIRVDDPNDVVITEDEVEYFFAMIKRIFPRIEVNRSNIVYTFSGVRPLAFGSVSEEQISRDHKIEVIAESTEINFPIFSLVGGKWTTFRAFSEQATDKILQRLGIKRRASTSNVKVGNAQQSTEDLESMIRKEDVVHLDDVIFRRTNTAMLGRATEARVEELARVSAEVLGWDLTKKQSEIARVKDIFVTKHGMDFTLYIDPSKKEAYQDRNNPILEQIGS